VLSFEGGPFTGEVLNSPMPELIPPAVLSRGSKPVFTGLHVVQVRGSRTTGRGSERGEEPCSRTLAPARDRPVPDWLPDRAGGSRGSAGDGSMDPKPFGRLAAPGR
jgi:hypothetical protein